MENADLEDYLSKVKLFWTASSQLDLEIYGSAIPANPDLVMENLIRAGFTHYISFELEDFTNENQAAWKRKWQAVNRKDVSAATEKDEGFSKLIEVDDFTVPKCSTAVEFVNTLHRIAVANKTRQEGQKFKVFMHCAGGDGRTGFMSMIMKKLFSPFTGWTW